MSGYLTGQYQLLRSSKLAPYRRQRPVQTDTSDGPLIDCAVSTSKHMPCSLLGTKLHTLDASNIVSYMSSFCKVVTEQVRRRRELLHVEVMGVGHRYGLWYIENWTRIIKYKEIECDAHAILASVAGFEYLNQAQCPYGPSAVVVGAELLTNCMAERVFSVPGWCLSPGITTARGRVPKVEPAVVVSDIDLDCDTKRTVRMGYIAPTMMAASTMMWVAISNDLPLGLVSSRALRTRKVN